MLLERPAYRAGTGIVRVREHNAAQCPGGGRAAYLRGQATPRQRWLFGRAGRGGAGRRLPKMPPAAQPGASLQAQAGQAAAKRGPTYGQLLTGPAPCTVAVGAAARQQLAGLLAAATRRVFAQAIRPVAPGAAVANPTNAGGPLQLRAAEPVPGPEAAAPGPIPPPGHLSAGQPEPRDLSNSPAKRRFRLVKAGRAAPGGAPTTPGQGSRPH